MCVGACRGQNGCQILWNWRYKQLRVINMVAGDRMPVFFVALADLKLTR